MSLTRELHETHDDSRLCCINMFGWAQAQARTCIVCKQRHHNCMKSDTVGGKAASSACNTRCLFLGVTRCTQHCHRDKTVHAAAMAHTWMPVYDRSSKLRLPMEVRSVGMTGSSPMHTLRTSESKWGAPARALLRVRLSSWVQKVASKADRLGQVSFSACSRLQPLQTIHTFLCMSQPWCLLHCCYSLVLSVTYSNDAGCAKQKRWSMLPVVPCDGCSSIGNA